MIAEVPLFHDGVAPVADRTPNLASVGLSLENADRALTIG
jgi:hypothetical protein